MTKAKSVATVPAAPRDITVIDTMIHAMQQVAVLIRQGYYPHPNLPMQVFPSTGTISVPLVIGTPDQFFVNAAAASTALAAEREHVQYLADVEQAATRQLEAAARAKMEADRAALIAEQKAAIAKLEADIATL